MTEARVLLKHDRIFCQHCANLDGLVIVECISLELSLYRVHWTGHTRTIQHLPSSRGPSSLWFLDSHPWSEAFEAKAAVAEAGYLGYFSSKLKEFTVPNSQLAFEVFWCWNVWIFLKGCLCSLFVVWWILARLVSSRLDLRFYGWKRLRPTRQRPWKPKPRQGNGDQRLAAVLPKMLC